jgi:glycosyltransferase involved in cell wall biosynthesis
MMNPPDGNPGARIRATLALCVKNHRSDLVATLKTVEAVRCTGPWELLIVDNGSDDGSAEAALDFARNSRLGARVVVEPAPGVSAARNRALREARGDVLVFIDDDVDCSPGFLEAHLRAFDDPSVHVTGGRIRPLLPGNAPGWLREHMEQEIGGPTCRYDFGDRPREIRKGSGLPMPASANAGMRRFEALDAGGFREDLGYSPVHGRILMSEDNELFQRMCRRGGRALYLPDAAVVHRVRPEAATTAYYRTWNIGYGRSSVRMRGRPGPFRAGIRVLGQLLRILRYSLSPYQWVFGSRAVRIRKRYQALGRILELLRISWNPRGIHR